MALTARGLRTLAPGAWLSESARGQGQLRAKGGRVGARFYFRYRRADNRTDDLPLGLYDAKGETGLTLPQAEAKAGELRKLYNAGTRDLREVLDAAARERALAREAAREAEAAQRTRTLGALLDAYAAQLERDGKPSAREVRRALLLHVRDAWPVLWGKPLADVTADDLLAIVAAPANVGTLRQAAKLRAYLRAAYSAGVKARTSAKALPALRALRVTANTAAMLTPIEGSNRARNRALSLAELRAYWRRIQAPECAALRFHLLTGCQRVQQLARATMADYDADVQSLRLLDGKGHRKEPRANHVPLLPEALHAMHAMHGGEAGPYLFTFTAGESGADYGGLWHRLREVVAAMRDAGELEQGPFTPGDLRRTVETRLADAGVSSDTRAFLLSHGLGGVQVHNYDRHDYLPHSRAALETLHRLLTDTSATVVPLRGKRA